MAEKESNFTGWLNEKILPLVGKFANTRFVRAVMGAGYSIIAFTIVGSMFLILSVLTQVITFPSFVDFYNSTLGRFNNLFTVIYNATMGIIALFFTGSFAYNYTKIYQQEENLDLSPLNGAFLSFFALFITVPQLVWKNGSAQFLTDAKNAVYSGYAISGSGLSRIGATGIFTGLIIGTLAIQIYRLCIKKGWSIKMPNSVPKGVSDSFTSLIPCFIIAVVVLLIDAVLIMCHTDIFNLLYIPFSFVSGLVDSWWGILIIVFLIHFLWFFGIHGATIITSFTNAFVLANMASNVSGSFHVFAGDFINSFITIGGSGATLGAVLYMAFMAKSRQMRELGKVAVVPGIFNINEPLLFGLPIVYNINLVVPFVLAPMASAMVGYFAIATHFVPKITAQQPWPTPVGLSGFIATQSWQGALVSVLSAVVAAAIWFPFIHGYDLKLAKKEAEGATEA